MSQGDTMVKILTEDGKTVLIREEDILNVWFLPDKKLTVVNFKQFDREMELWTRMSIEEIQEQLSPIALHDLGRKL
jgi:hypothetical protein